MAEYCLRWNNHQPNLVTVFSELLTAESLVDVTLASDGHFIHAHKLVLSACSVYFKDLFGSNPCKHPIVFLKDIRIEDLKTVIDFIYRGEVNVSQERLQDVLKTAESLRIKGLADKPFSYDEYPSQSRGQHLSSSFSSQRSSLTDSRDQGQSVDAEDGADGAGNSPPVTKKRKVASSQESSESVQDGNNHESDEKDESAHQKKAGEDAAAKPPSASNSSSSSALKDKVKEEKEAPSSAVATITPTEPRPEYKESRAADAMLMLQASSSEGGGDDSATPSQAPPTSTALSENAAALMSSHSQGNLDWSLSLGHWWASVLPALAQQHHHHHHTPPPTSLYLRAQQQQQHLAQVSAAASSNTTTPSIGSSSARPPDTSYKNTGAGVTISHAWGGNGSTSTSREGSPASGGQLVVGPLDQLALVSALGKEISPQMVQALQAVAARRESFSSAAKLYSVSVTTLWRYYRKLGLSDNNPK